MRVVRRSWLVLVTIGAVWPARAPAQGVSPGVPSAAGAAVAPAGSVAKATPTKTPTPVTAVRSGAALGAPAGNAGAGGSPIQGSSVFPTPTKAPPAGPPFVLSEVYYFEPWNGTKYNGYLQGNEWHLQVADTTKAAGVTFLFDSNVPKGEISEIIEKKTCCSELRVAGQTVQVTSLAFSGERVFVRAVVPDMQAWPKSVQLHLYHSGITASPGEASRASASGGGGGGSSASAALAQAPIAAANSSAPIIRPFMDYKSTPATLQAKKFSYFVSFLYPTFSHDRCTDCHSMGDALTLHNQHVAGGILNVSGFDPKTGNCAFCHSQVQQWMTPAFSKNINWRGKDAKTICGIVTAHLPTAEKLHGHFHDDPRVIWAVNSGWIPRNAQGNVQPPLPTAPPHSANAWFQLVDYWINGGFPCPN
jgi:hypothetical protein